MPGMNIEIRKEVWDILVTSSPLHNLTFQQYIRQYAKGHNDLPTIEDLKRLFPSLLIDEIVLALGVARWQLENE